MSENLKFITGSDKRQELFNGNNVKYIKYKNAYKLQNGFINESEYNFDIVATTEFWDAYGIVDEASFIYATTQLPFFYADSDNELGPTVSDFLFDGSRLRCNLTNIPIGYPTAINYPPDSILAIYSLVVNENLLFFNIQNNPISGSLNLSVAPNLTDVIITNTNISQLNSTNSPSLVRVLATNSQLSGTLDMSNKNNINTIYLTNTNVTSINLTNSTLDQTAFALAISGCNFTNDSMNALLDYLILNTPADSWIQIGIQDTGVIPDPLKVEALELKGNTVGVS